MNKTIIILFFLIIIYGLYNAKYNQKIEKIDHKKSEYKVHIEEHQKSHYRDELPEIDSIEYAKRYIISVINYGSYNLGFVGGVMEGGFASKEDAPKIACYVLNLSGKKCEGHYAKDAQMFYTSICGGCHGNDGKGLNGNYPDLTKKQLLGISRREQFLRSMLER